MTGFDSAVVLDADGEVNAKVKAQNTFQDVIAGVGVRMDFDSYEIYEGKTIPVETVGGQKVVQTYLRYNQRFFYKHFAEMKDSIQDQPVRVFMDPDSDVHYDLHVVALDTCHTSRLLRSDASPILTEDQLDEVCADCDSPWVCVAHIEG